jgi:hypothetical protein
MNMRRRITIALLTAYLVTLLPLVSLAQLAQCTITAQVFLPDGRPAAGAQLEIKSAFLPGYLLATSSFVTPRANSSGVLSFTVPRNAKIRVKGAVWAGNLDLSKDPLGVLLQVPDASTATLTSLVPPVLGPDEIPIAVPPGAVAVNSSTRALLNETDPVGTANIVTDNVGGLWLRGPNGYFSVNGERVDVKEKGAKGDAKIVNDASVSGTTLTSATAAFTSADTGKKFDVAGAGVAAELSAIITGYTDSTHVTLSVAASYTGSSKTISLDAATIGTGSMTAGSAILAAGSAFFTADDVGKLVRVTDVGARNISGTMTYVNATTATMSVSASVTVSGRRLIFGTDDHAAIAAAIAALPNGGEIYFPKGKYLNGSELTVNTPNLTFNGAGMNASEVYSIGPKMLDAASVFHLLDINTPASNVHFQDIGFSGTNWTAQTTNFGADIADGIYVNVNGPISNITATNCRFDSFWGIGFHAPGSAGTTRATSNSITDITLTDCQAALNSYDGANPCPISGLDIKGGAYHHNGTAGIETATSDATINTHAFYNLQGGVSVGGYGGGTQYGSDVTIRGMYKFNGFYGIGLGTNMRNCQIVGATASQNGYAGIQMLSDPSGTIGGNNRAIGCIVFSNGTFGILIGDPDTSTENCHVYNDASVVGYSQIIGINVSGSANNSHSLGNKVTGHASSDYAYQGSSGNSLDYDPSVGSTVFIGGGATVNYPSLKVSDINSVGSVSTEVGYAKWFSNTFKIGNLGSGRPLKFEATEMTFESSGFQWGVYLDGMFYPNSNGTQDIGATGFKVRRGYFSFMNLSSFTPTGTGDSAGVVGDVSRDDSFVYVKTSAGWKRAALSTF